MTKIVPAGQPITLRAKHSVVEDEEGHVTFAFDLGTYGFHRWYASPYWDISYIRMTCTVDDPVWMKWWMHNDIVKVDRNEFFSLYEAKVRFNDDGTAVIRVWDSYKERFRDVSQM